MISRCSDTKPTGQTRTSVTPSSRSASRWSRMSGPSHGSPVCGLALERERPAWEHARSRPRAAAVSRSESRYVSPSSTIRAGSECAVKTTCAVGAADAVGEQVDEAVLASPLANEARRDTARRPRRSNRPWYFAIESDDQCGASTSPTRASCPSSSARSTAACDAWLPVAHAGEHRQPEPLLERGPSLLGHRR